MTGGDTCTLSRQCDTAAPMASHNPACLLGLGGQLPIMTIMPLPVHLFPIAPPQPLPHQRAMIKVM